MAQASNRKAEGRRAARQAARTERQSTRQARRTERQQSRQAGRTARTEARAGSRASRTQSKAEGGYYSPESTAARWQGIAAVGEQAVTVGAGIATGGASLAAGGFGAAGQNVLTGDDQVDSQFQPPGGAAPITEQAWFWPAVIGGGAVVIWSLTRGGK